MTCLCLATLALPLTAQGGSKLSSEDKVTIIERLDELLRETYVFEDVANTMGDQLLQNLADGADDLFDQANSDALIVDLRQNGGGDPAMVQLISSDLFDEPTHLNSLYFRAEDSLEEFWTLDEVVGQRMADNPVFVLTSSSTFSAAEEFTYNLKCLGRATIVGETTGGGAHPGGVTPLHESLSVFIPAGRAINPITGTNWEGTGVIPDVPVEANAALDKALELAGQAAQERRELRS